MASEHMVVINTCPDEDCGARIAAGLVSAGHAACVNIVPGVRSIYQWQGKLEDSRECLLFIKSTADRYREIEAFIRAHHPYQLPEIIALPIAAGLPAYLEWVSGHGP